MDKIDKLLAIEEIKNLRIRYTHLLDSNQIGDITNLFSEDALCQTDREPWRGRTEIKKGLEKAFSDFDIKNETQYPFLHVVTNQHVELLGENEARGICYLTDNVTQRNKSDSTLLLLGIYKDEYKKINGQWFITKSNLDVVWNS